jgi:uncharacterized protein
MLHPHSALKFVNEVIGSGIFATKFIPKGTITYIKDSLEIELDQHQYHAQPKAMQEVIDKYSYIDEHGHYIVSWDHAKYINHNCDPNTISTGYGFEIAIKDIQPGDEITDEYGLFNLDKAFVCQCGSYKCRAEIHPEDIEQYGSIWDEQIRPALLQFDKVPQPLATHMAEETSNLLNLFLKKTQHYKSVKALKFDSRTVTIALNGTNHH